MDGSRVADDPKAEIRSLRRRQYTVFLSMTGQPEHALAIGTDPTIAVNEKGPYVVWTGRSGLEAKLPHEGRVVTLAPDGAFATIAGSGSVFTAWESQGAIVVTRLDQ